MKFKDKKIKQLQEKYKEIALLGNISALLGWDLNVNLPTGAAESRAEHSAFMAKIISERWLDPKFKDLLDSVNAQYLNSNEKAIVRNLKQAAKFYHQVPKEIIIEFEETSSKAYVSWVEARSKDNFSIFAPYLSKMVRLNQIIAKHYGYSDNPYDALLDMYEAGLTTKDVKLMFNNLTPRLIKLLEKVIQMAKDDAYCIDIVHQSIAVQAALKKVDEVILENHLKTCVADSIRKGQTNSAVSEIVEILHKK